MIPPPFPRSGWQITASLTFVEETNDDRLRILIQPMDGRWHLDAFHTARRPDRDLSLGKSYAYTNLGEVPVLEEAMNLAKAYASEWKCEIEQEQPTKPGKKPIAREEP